MGRRLKEWEEVVDIPEKVKGDRIIFRNLGEVQIDDKDVLLKARKNIGRKIAVLYTDIKGREYLIRVME